MLTIAHSHCEHLALRERVTSSMMGSALRGEPILLDSICMPVLEAHSTKAASRFVRR